MCVHLYIFAYIHNSYILCVSVHQVCMYMHVCTSLGTHRHTYAKAHMETQSWCLLTSRVIFHFIHWGRVLHRAQTYEYQLVWFARCLSASLSLPSKCWHYGGKAAWLSHGSENLNSGPHACTANILSTKSSPRPPFYTLWTSEHFKIPNSKK